MTEEHTCQCEGRGQCPVFKMFMSQRQHAICKGTAGIPEEERSKIISAMKLRAGMPPEVTKVPRDPHQSVTIHKPSKLPKNQIEPVLGRYPGANLAMLLQKCGVHVNTGCGCEEWIGKMNAWGVDGCYEHRQEIVDRLSEQAKKLSTSQMVWTGILMMWHGIRPTIGELVDEAIWSASNVIANEK